MNLTPYQVFDCADGHIIIATGNDAQYQRLCRLLGLDDMAQATEFLKNSDRIANRDRMTELLTEATSKRAKADLLAACEAEGVPAGPINDLAEVMADPQVRARGMQIDLDGVPGVRSPYVFSDAELALHRPSPKLGEDDPDECTKRTKEIWMYKNASQPLNTKSAGCMFKNPRGLSAGSLIDRAGLKGFKVGNAEVSEKHANFIVAHPGCTSEDIEKLVSEVRDRVQDKHGVTLESEVQRWP